MRGERRSRRRRTYVTYACTDTFRAEAREPMVSMSVMPPCAKLAQRRERGRQGGGRKKMREIRCND
jgi:hypothetical protein